MKDLKTLKNEGISLELIFCHFKNNDHENYVNRYKYIYKRILSGKKYKITHTQTLTDLSMNN